MQPTSLLVKSRPEAVVWPTSTIRRNRLQADVTRRAETQNEQRRSNFSPPPPPPPPRRPPPPPPTPTSGPPIDRRAAIFGGGAGLLAIGTLLLRGSNVSSSYERDLSYVASQVGVRGMPSPVSAIVDRQGRIVGLDITGKGGNYVATVDPRNPSFLLLKAANGSVYRLATRYERVNLADRRAMEAIFRVLDWEQQLQ